VEEFDQNRYTEQGLDFSIPNKLIRAGVI
jgi:hypothetical protein